MKYWKIIVVILVFFSIAVFLGKTPPALPKLAKFPAFKLNSQENQPFSEANLLGKNVVFAFFFTSCEGPCPILTAELVRLQKEFINKKDLLFVTVSIDPQRDSPEKLKEYAQKISANLNNWVFLTGDIEEITKLSEGGLSLGLDPAGYNHSTKVILIDKESYIRGLFDSQDRNELKQLKNSINSL